MLSLPELAAEMQRLSALLDNGLAKLREQAEELADTENAYRKERAKSWLTCPTDAPGTKAADRVWTSAHRDAWVDAETADLRRARDVAEGTRQAALESVRSRRTQISALQSLLAAYKADSEWNRTAP